MILANEANRRYINGLDRIRIDRAHNTGSIDPVNSVYTYKVERIHAVEGIAAGDSEQPRPGLVRLRVSRSKFKNLGTSWHGPEPCRSSSDAAYYSRARIVKRDGRCRHSTIRAGPPGSQKQSLR